MDGPQSNVFDETFPQTNCQTTLDNLLGNGPAQVPVWTHRAGWEGDLNVRGHVQRLSRQTGPANMLLENAPETPYPMDSRLATLDNDSTQSPSMTGRSTVEHSDRYWWNLERPVNVQEGFVNMSGGRVHIEYDNLAFLLVMAIAFLFLVIRRK